tara:strand:+ start:181 stop:369 length:189 start_codon:yes stop_codon:yes gene_type:complete
VVEQVVQIVQQQLQMVEIQFFQVLHQQVVVDPVVVDKVLVLFTAVVLEDPEAVRLEDHQVLL